MSKKTSVPALLALFVLALVFAGAAHASVTSVIAMDSFISEVNAGESNEALAHFAEDAVVTNRMTGRSYSGAEEISAMLEGWQSPGRVYDIVSLEMYGDTVNVTLDVSDRGLIWGQQRMTAEYNEGLIQNLDLVAMRLTVFPVRHR